MTIDTSSAKHSRALITFEYELGQKFYRVTNANRDIPTHFGIFFSDSSIKLTLPPHVASFTQQRATIELDANKSAGILAILTAAEVHSPVTMTVREYSSDAKQEQFDVKYRFIGKVRLAEINVGGRLNRVKLIAQTIGGEVDLKMGMVTSVSCINPFGNVNTCGVDVDALKVNGTVTAVDRQLISISGVPYDEQDPTYWNQGYVDMNGARSKILYRDGNSADFFLAEYACPLWVGMTIVVAPGCDHTTTVCQGRYNNIANSNFLSIDRLQYNPQFENVEQ